MPYNRGGQRRRMRKNEKNVKLDDLFQHLNIEMCVVVLDHRDWTGHIHFQQTNGYLKKKGAEKFSTHEISFLFRPRFSAPMISIFLSYVCVCVFMCTMAELRRKFHLFMPGRSIFFPHFSLVQLKCVCGLNTSGSEAQTQNPKLTQ